MMNGVQTFFAGMTTQATGNVLVQGGAAGAAGQSANGSAFAALVASLLGGEALPETAQSLSIASLFANGTLGAAESIEGSSDEEASLEAMLEQLAAWIGSLSAEMQRKLAAEPRVAEWMAMANAELEMASDASASFTAAVAFDEAAEAEASVSAKPLSDLLDRLIKALDAEADQPYLVVVARQATVTVVQAIVAMQSLETGAAESLTGAASTQRTAATEVSSGAKPSALEIASWLSKTNGVVETESQPRSEASNGNVRWAHLSAMQAKTVLLRVAGTDTPNAAMSVESAAKGAETVSTESNGALSSNLADAIKTAQTEAAPKAEAAPRLPLSEAAERLNEWVLKQSATGGNLKAETVLKLMPEHLGQVEVKLSMQNGQLAATITTESAMAKEALESNLAALRTSLQNQGVTVERLVVSQQQPSGFQSGMFQEGRQQRQPAGREGARDERERKEQGAEDWAEVLAVNAEQEAADLGNYGSSFRAEA